MNTLDDIALIAMQAIIPTYKYSYKFTEAIVKESYKIADAMIKESNKYKSENPEIDKNLKVPDLVMMDYT